MRRSAFEKKCRRVAKDVLGDEGEVDIGAERDHQEPFQDDGVLFVSDRKAGRQAMFGIGQDMPMKEYDEKTRAIMTALGLKVTDRVLITMNPCSKFRIPKKG